MAKFGISGIDDIAETLKKAGELGNGEITSKILDAQAQVYIEKWKKAIDRSIRNPRRSTNNMRDSVNAKQVGRLTVDVYPMGKDRKGVRNAEKAFIHHYGRSNMKGSRFVDIAESDAEQPALEAAQKIMDEFIEKL